MIKHTLYTASIAAIVLSLTPPLAHANGFGASGDTIPFFVNGAVPSGQTSVGSWTQNALTITGNVVAGTVSGANTANGATVIANGGVQLGSDLGICGAAQAGTMRWNPASASFEGCNGTGWQPIGGGSLTMVVGGCQGAWSTCPSGYHATSYFSPGTYNCCDKCGNPSWKYTVCSQ